jgi:hypothetical protein
MVQGFYTLQEAAQFLGISEEEVRKRTEAKSLRTFMDRGTLRFRVQDIQEIAREMGLSSEPELALGDSSLQKPGSGAARSGLTPRSATPRRSGLAPKSDQPSSGVKPKSSGRMKGPTPEVFDFDLGVGGLDDVLDVGRERPSSAKRKSQLKEPTPAPKSNPRKSRLKPGSDSEIRLVNEGSDLSLTAEGGDSNIKVGHDSAARKQTGLGSKASPRPKPKSKQSSDSQPIDSGIRLVPMDNSPPMSTSSEEIPLGVQPPPSGEDSDVRLELPKNPSHIAMAQTDEIDLDREIKQAPAPREGRLKPKSTLQFSSSSPFELSDDDVPSPSKSGTVDSSDFDLAPTGTPQGQEGSSDFDLSPSGDDQSGSSDFDLQPSAEDGAGTTDFDMAPAGLSGDGSSDFQLTPEGADEDFSLSPEGSTDFDLSPSAGAQAGSSEFELEEESESTDLGDMSLELSAEDLAAGQEENMVDTGLSFGGDEDMSLMLENTPKPAPRQDLAPPSDSEFELSLEDGTGSMAGDSEFELTLDDGSAGGEPLQSKAEGEHIFDSDFEVPALDESGSEVATIDTDLESSDFDLALDESDAIVDDESASQVIALDEDEQTFDGEVEELVEEGDDLDQQGFDTLEDPGELQEIEDENAPVREVVVEKFIEPAPWGVIPVVFMLPCAVVTIVLGIMGYEMVQSSNGFRPAGPVTKMVAGLFGKDLK